MAFFDVDLDVAGIDQVLDDFNRAGGDASSSMAIVAEMLVAAVQDEFETEGRGGWPGFAESTLRRRAGGKLLQDTGNFAGSIEAVHGPTFAEAATGVEYAIHHVFGAPGANIPQRNPFDIPEQVFEDAAEFVLDEILRAVA